MVNYVKSNALKAQMATKKQNNHFEEESKGNVKTRSSDVVLLELSLAWLSHVS